MKIANITINMKISSTYLTPSVNVTEALAGSVLAVSGEGNIQDFSYVEMDEE